MNELDNTLENKVVAFYRRYSFENTFYSSTLRAMNKFLISYEDAAYCWRRYISELLEKK
jgi:hypothetical protein